MFEEIEEQLLSLVSPELTLCYMQVLRALSEVGITTWVDDLTDIIDEVENVGRDEIIFNIDTYIHALTESCIKQFGVTISEEFDLRLAVDILLGINQLTNYEDTLSIESICMAERDPEERLGDLMELVTSRTCDECLTIIERVTPKLFKRILEQLGEGLKDYEEEIRDNTHYIVRVRSLLPHVEKPWLVEDIDQGLRIGANLKTMLQAFKVRFDNYCEINPGVNRMGGYVGEQYLLYILASDVPDSELLTVAQDSINDIANYAPLIAAINRTVQTLLAKAQNK